MPAKTEEIHIRLTKKEKAELKRRANAEKRSISNYLLYHGLVDTKKTHIDKIIKKEKKQQKFVDTAIERIERVRERQKARVDTRKTDLSAEVRNDRKNLFKNMKVKDILKKT